MAESAKRPPDPPPTEPAEDVYRLIVPDDLRPVDRRSLEPVVPEVVREDKPEEPDDVPLGPFQFTLRDMLLLMTGVAVWLGLMNSVNWGWSIMAGLAGVAALLSLIMLTAFEPENRNVRLAWWGLFGIYLLTCLTAIIKGG